MRNLYVVVHTEAQHHVDDLVGGWYDSELTDAGRVQAQRIADHLRRAIPETATGPVYASDLRRAAQTAEPIAAALGVEVVHLPGLRELSYGVAEGRPNAWLNERFTPAPPHDRLDHGSGIEGAETKRQFATRIAEALDVVLADEREHQVIVTHGFALTFVVMAWARIPVEHVGWVNLRAEAGSITHLVEDDFLHNRAVRVLNGTAHLRP